MNSTIRYDKPSMTNMPREVGLRIFNEILNSPVPDRKKMMDEADMLEKQMKAEREKRKNDAK